MSMEEQDIEVNLAGTTRDFARMGRLALRFLKTASYLIIGVTLLVVVREVVEGFRFFDSIHPLLGWIFLAVVAAGLWFLVGRTILRFWRLPPALKQPRLQGGGDPTLKDVERRLAFVMRYLGNLRRNPRMEERSAAVEEAMRRAEALKRRLAGREAGDAARAQQELEAFEAREMEPLLRPLDEEASKVIRQEALVVGIGTAVSMNGTLDAFIVLWRNVNLVARVATIYFGRPGPRGCIVIIRDVAAAMFIAVQMQGVMEAVGGFFGGWFGKAGNALMGPAGDGAINALATVRIGYVAKARCRAYRPWNEATIPEIMRRTMKEVGLQGRGIVKDVLSAALKTGLVKVPADLARKTGDFLAGLFGKEKPAPQA